jgi:hypothetical protein
VNISSSI